MIQATELNPLFKREDVAEALSAIAPESVIPSDLKAQGDVTVYSLVAQNDTGVFGFATLTLKETKDLPAPLKHHVCFEDEAHYFELSLVYATVPEGLEEDPEADDDLTTQYCRLFYKQLQSYLNTYLIHDRAIVVTVSEEESENMMFFGAWPFETITCGDGTFQSVMRLERETPPDKEELMGLLRNVEKQTVTFH